MTKAGYLHSRAAAFALSALGVAIGGLLLATSSAATDQDTQAIKQVIEREQRDSIAAVVFPTNGPMAPSDYQQLMDSRVQALSKYYTGPALVENQAKLNTSTEVPGYPPDKLAAAASAGETPPAITKLKGQTFDPNLRPIAAAVTGIKWDSIEVTGDSARVIADVDSWINWQMRTGAKTTTQHVPTPALFTFTLRKIAGDWRIATEQLQYPENGTPSTSPS